MMIKVTSDVITAEPVIKTLDIKIHGAITTFLGTIRLYNEGRTVRYIDYEAYPEMAEEQMLGIAKEILKMPEVEDVSIFHRIGHLNVGETSLVVAVASKHRREGFNACLYTVERIKELVPVWKKEVWAEGSEWIRSKGA